MQQKEKKQRWGYKAGSLSVSQVWSKTQPKATHYGNDICSHKIVWREIQINRK